MFVGKCWEPGCNRLRDPGFNACELHHGSEERDTDDK